MPRRILSSMIPILSSSFGFASPPTRTFPLAFEGLPGRPKDGGLSSFDDAGRRGGMMRGLDGGLDWIGLD